MSVLKFIYKNLDHFKTRFFLVFLAGIVDGAASFLIPVLLAEFTKKELSSLNLSRLIVYIVSLYFLSLIMSWFIRKYGESLASQFGNHIRLKYFDRLGKLPIDKLKKKHSGYIISLINSVADGLGSIVFKIFWTLALSISSISLFLYFTARESPLVALVNFGILVVFVIVSTYLAGKMVPLSRDFNLKKASLLESLTDFIANILTVKKLGVYDFAEKKLKNKAKESNLQIEKLQNFHAGRWFMLHGLFGIAFISTLVFLLFQISIGVASVSILILFIAAYAIIKGQVAGFSESFKEIMEMRAYIESIDKIVNQTTEEGGELKINSWKKIVFKNIVFQHSKKNKKIEISNFDIYNGEKIFIYGKSGEGKTTFLDIFSNILKPEKGERFIDDKNYEQVAKGFFYDNITTVSQESELFNISLRENIVLGSDIKIDKVKKLLNDLDLSQDLYDKLEEKVGEKGLKLSAGQKQRINIARSLLMSKTIYLLDEPTSNLDTITEKRVIDFLRKNLSGKTAIIVSHSKELEKICNRSYTMKDRCLVEKRH